MANINYKQKQPKQLLNRTRNQQIVPDIWSPNQFTDLGDSLCNQHFNFDLCHNHKQSFTSFSVKSLCYYTANISTYQVFLLLDWHLFLHVFFLASLLFHFHFACRRDKIWHIPSVDTVLLCAHSLTRIQQSEESQENSVTINCLFKGMHWCRNRRGKGMRDVF